MAASAEIPDNLWTKVQQLPEDAMRQVQGLYGPRFPIEVRHFFADWIERQPWSSINEEDSAHEKIAEDLRDQLIQQIENKAEELSTDDNMFLTKLKFQQTAQQFRNCYGGSAMSLVADLKQCLNVEQRLVYHYINSTDGNARASRPISQTSTHRAFLDQFRALHAQTQETEEILRAMQHHQESFILQHQEYTKINSQISQLQQSPNGQTRVHNMQVLQTNKQRMEGKLRPMAQNLLDQRLMLGRKHKDTLDELSKLQKSILDDQLIGWQRQQQLAGNGAPVDGDLDTIQQWCESLAELIWTNRQQIIRVQMQCQQLPITIPPGEPDIMPHLSSTISNLLETLVTSTFIIEKQPPQVLKKDAKFTATVRLLVGGKLNVYMSPPTVKATIISEEQAKAILRNDKDAKKQCSGEIFNSEGPMEYHQVNGQLSVTFRNMQLKRIRRAEKKGNETVTEEKFSVLFQCEFNVGGGELVFQVWTLSLPAVVTVHGNQECNALATILWDNAFAEPGRTPFQVPDQVTWSQLANALNTKFTAACGRKLSAENCAYLGSKLFDFQDDYTNCHVTWTQFNREPLQGRNFTFWEWFYAIMKLTKDWLQEPWKQGLIMGFVSKQKAQDYLLTRPNATFLLRFSDSEIGGITIAWVADDPKQEGRQVWNLAPFVEKDFKIRGLGDRVKDLDHLQNLYPDMPKSVAFSRFWTQDQDDTDLLTSAGYVRPGLATTVPSMTQPARNNPFGDMPSPQPFDVASQASVQSPSAASNWPIEDSKSDIVSMDEAQFPEASDFFTDHNPDNDFEGINISVFLPHQ